MTTCYTDLPASVRRQVHTRVAVTVAVGGVVATATRVVTVTPLVRKGGVELLTEQGADPRPQLVNAASNTRVFCTVRRCCKARTQTHIHTYTH